MGKKKTKEEFIKEATEKHKGKYDYSNVEYVNTDTKVCIICHDHGEFWQKPHSHLNGNGCPICGGTGRLTKDFFIKKANEIHHGKYDYSKVEYENCMKKVCIICSEHGHGEFWQKPNAHLNGQGCPICGGTCRSSKEEFIKEAREVHGDKYNYDKVEYNGAHTKICIICHKHGEFWQGANNHLRGQGCPKCKGDKTRERQTLPKEDFIKKSNELHKDKYDYSKVDYVNCKTKVCIICPEHGEFWQRPNDHNQGKGCPICGGTGRLTKDFFIKKSNELHKDKYDYSKVNYVNNRTKVCIICPKHGEFWQKPNAHLNGCGCPKCHADKTRERLTLSKEAFIKKANEVHGDKYDYNKVDYVNGKTKVSIICKNHGIFWQRPESHTLGIGCPKCNLSHL